LYGGGVQLRLNSAGLTIAHAVTQTQRTPSMIGSVALAGGALARGVTVMGNFAYTTNGNVATVDTLEIFDISVSTAPVKVGGLPFSNQGLGQPIVAGNVLYSGINSATGTVQIVDVSNPKTPAILGQISATNGCQALALSGSTLYVGMAATAFRIYDVSDPTAPLLKSTLVLSAFNGTVGIALQGKYAYIAGTQLVGNTGGLYIYDVSNPAAPALVFNYTTTGGSARGLVISGKYLYLLCFGAATGLETIDISDPAAPVFVKSTAIASTGISVIPVITGRYLYLASGGTASNGVEVFDINDPANPVSMGSGATTTAVNGIAVSGNRLYLTANAQLQVWNTFGVDLPTGRIGSLSTDNLYADGVSYFNGDMYAQRGLAVGAAGIMSRGPLAGSLLALTTVSGSPGIVASTLQTTGYNAVTGVDSGSRIQIVNTDLATVNNISRIQFATFNSSSAVVTTSMISGVHVAHTAAAESGSIMFQTREAGAMQERMRITTAGIGIGAVVPSALLHIGGASSSPATVRSYNTYVDSANGEWAYAGDWLSNVARYGTGMNGSGVARNVQMMVGGVDKLNYGVSNAGAWTINDKVFLNAPAMLAWGNTVSFPALKRSTLINTELQTRLADDSAFAPLAASVMAQAASEFGARIEFRSLTEVTTLAIAATTNTTIQIPANAVVLAVSTRVTVLIPTATSFSVGVAGTAGRYAAGVLVAAGTTNPGTLAGPLYYAAATPILITPSATPATATGQIRVTIHYYLVTPPTS
jgi:hypothetical protein